MTEFLLAKPVLPEGWIDTSVGEAHVVRDHLTRIFDLKEYELPNVPRMHEYPTPIGYKPLVQLLEEKHKAPVIITNGAKQALGGCFYALKQMNKATMAMRIPYWALIPPLAELHGVQSLAAAETIQSYLLVMPNNPDGFCMGAEESLAFAAQCKEANMPLIHDAAYYTHVYLPFDRPLPPLGDVQIYSISKMYGLSGLRLGYVVCQNPDFYKHVQAYMETTTVGVSIIPQIFLFDILRRMRAYPTLAQRFEAASAQDLLKAKKLIQQVRPDILQVPADIEQTPGMFGFFKRGPKADFDKAKINIVDGSLFGLSGFVRMNLAFDEATILDIVQRLNQSVVESNNESPAV